MQIFACCLSIVIIYRFADCKTYFVNRNIVPFFNAKIKYYYEKTNKIVNRKEGDAKAGTQYPE
jgi:vacuolar-type H+-ATPase subunit C/Vma6